MTPCQYHVVHKMAITRFPPKGMMAYKLSGRLPGFIRNLCSSAVLTDVEPVSLAGVPINDITAILVTSDLTEVEGLRRYPIQID